MKIIYLLFTLINTFNCDKNIKNIDLPACKSCIHYKPSLYNNDFTSTFNKCNKFGNKDIITNEIRYDFVDSCRNNESKCGLEGKYYEEEKNLKLKILKHNIISNFPFYFFILLVIKYLK